MVERSNQIMLRLQKTAGTHPDIQQQLATLPRYQCLMFGGLKVLVLHGDPESLAGWGLAHESVAAGNERRLEDWFRESGADVMVSTHTCLPVLWSGCVQGRPCVLANNGSSGMGNLNEDTRGLIARISRTASTFEPVAGLVSAAGLHLDLMPVDYDVSAWLEQFDQLWPAGSSAAISYRQRLLEGTPLSPCDLIFPSSPQSFLHWRKR